MPLLPGLFPLADVEPLPASISDFKILSKMVPVSPVGWHLNSPWGEGSPDGVSLVDGRLESLLLCCGCWYTCGVPCPKSWGLTLPLCKMGPLSPVSYLPQRDLVRQTVEP